MPRKKTERLCEICGKPFFYSTHFRTVCSEECLQKRREMKLKEYNNKRRMGRHLKHYYAFNDIPKTDTMTALERDVMEAERLGVSYGYYMATRGDRG